MRRMWAGRAGRAFPGRRSRNGEKVGEARLAQGAMASMTLFKAFLPSWRRSGGGGLRATCASCSASCEGSPDNISLRLGAVRRVQVWPSARPAGLSAVGVGICDAGGGDAPYLHLRRRLDPDPEEVAAVAAERLSTRLVPSQPLVLLLAKVAAAVLRMHGRGHPVVRRRLLRRRERWLGGLQGVALLGLRRAQGRRHLRRRSWGCA